MNNTQYTILVMLIALFALEAARSKNVKTWLVTVISSVRSQVVK